MITGTVCISLLTTTGVRVRPSSSRVSFSAVEVREVTSEITAELLLPLNLRV